MCHLVDFGKITFTNKIANLILWSKTLKHSEVFHQIEPPPNHVWLLRNQGSVFSLGSRSHYYDLILESDNNTLLKV